LFVGGGVAVEHGGGGDFFAAEVFGDGLEGEVLGFLCVEEDAAVGGESGCDGLLWLYRLASGEELELSWVSYIERCDRLAAGGTLYRHLCCCCSESVSLLVQERSGRSDSRSRRDERCRARSNSQGRDKRRGHCDYIKILIRMKIHSLVGQERRSWARTQWRLHEE
jgi:hypothetical protein